MCKYAKGELEEAIFSLSSTLHKCKKIQEKDRLLPAQKTLNDRRVKALEIALSLLKEELAADCQPYSSQAL